MCSHLCLFGDDNDVSGLCPVCKLYVRIHDVEDDDDDYDDRPLLRIIIRFWCLFWSHTHCVEDNA